MLVCVLLSCLFLADVWSPAGEELTSSLSCVLCFLVFCQFIQMCLGPHQNKGRGWSHETSLSPLVK